MRVKIFFENDVLPEDIDGNQFLINIPDSLKTFLDLHEYLYQKFDLGKHLESGESLIFYIEDTRIPLQEEIKAILINNDEKLR